MYLTYQAPYFLYLRNSSSEHAVASLPWPGTRRPPCRDGCRRRWSGRRLPKRWCTQSTPQRVSSQIVRRQIQTDSKIMTHLPRYRLRGWLPPLALDTGGGTWWEISENNREFIYYIYSLPHQCIFWMVEFVRPNSSPESYLYIYILLIDCTWLTFLLTIKDIWFDLNQKWSKNSSLVKIGLFFFLTYSRK